eukprot:3198300-Rhodomonas_salina.1
MDSTLYYKAATLNNLEQPDWALQNHWTVTAFVAIMIQTPQGLRKPEDWAQGHHGCSASVPASASLAGRGSVRTHSGWQELVMPVIGSQVHWQAHSESFDCAALRVG